jgi:predicted alpha/beta superfamily hydrolase
MKSKPATILASEMRMMESKHTGRKYRITISLPYVYAEPRVEDWPFIDAPAKWPVVYLLDANWYFGMVTDLIRAMAWCGNTTDAIVVGIGYHENTDSQEAWREAFARRYIDFTPIRDEVSEKWHSEVAERPCTAGDASNFLNFMKNEVIPMVENEYQIDPSKRILAGHSHGGLFTAFALLEQPGLFRFYIIGSPSLSYGNKFIFNCEEQFAIRRKRLPANVYLSVGELEETADDTTLADTLRFAAILESRKYKGLSLRKQIFTDMNHCEVIAPGFQAGLKIALRKLQPIRV